MHGLEGFISLLKQFFPPNFDLRYLWALRVPILETLEMAAGAMLFAGTAGLLLAVYLGAPRAGRRLVVGLLAPLPDRSRPALALLFLVGVGGWPPAPHLGLRN